MNWKCFFVINTNSQSVMLNPETSSGQACFSIFSSIFSEYALCFISVCRFFKTLGKYPKL
jgi:hypothetical protein